MSNDVTPEAVTRPAFIRWALLPPLLLTALSLASASLGYLVFHTLAEIFSIVIAATALVVATTSRDFTRNHFIVYVAVAIGWCAALDLVHTLAYKGMGLLPTDSANPATQLWIAARFMQAAALLAAPLFLTRPVRLGWLHAGFGALAGLALLAIAGGAFPDAYVDGQGLTPFKIYAEYLIILMLGLALTLLWRRRALLSGELLLGMTAALVAMMLSEFLFTRYVSVYAGANMAGHVLKIFAYWFVYLALVDTTLRQPFGALARAASTYDAVPDPTLIVDGTGHIRQANAAAARQVALPVARLAGRHVHTLFHDAALAPAACPVCGPLAAGRDSLLVEMEIGEGRAVECSVAPLGGEGEARAHVQVVRDISERRHLAREREQLVLDLEERVKELRCLYAISALSEQTGLTEAGLLSRTVALLPGAFRFPDHLRAEISSDWGTFGQLGDLPAGQRLERRVRLNGLPVGQIRVGYDTGVTGSDVAFLAEELALMDTVASRLGETLARIQATARVRRLTYLYEMLSATNRAIVRCRNVDELLRALFDALTAHGAFPMLFIAVSDGGRPPLRLLHTHGLEPEWRPLLAAALADPDSPFSHLQADLMAGRTVWMPVPEDTGADPWLAYLRSRGFQGRALLPLLREGTLLGVAGLYAEAQDTFDADQSRLLDEMAMDVSFALGNLLAQERRQNAERQASLSEHRFREVFESSPLPMQIHSADTGIIRSINRAHQQWLGYGLADLAHEDAWFDKVYDDPEQRRKLREAWKRDLLTAQETGEPVSSPELVLRRKDGGRRVARGTMTRVGDDVVVAWTDLTDIRQGEKALRESEQRFRGMIEQTITGIYVRLERAFVYVNPRFCEMVGWSSEDLLGKDLRDFVPPESESLPAIQAAWDRLRAGERSVSLITPFRRKDGEVIELGLHGTRADWGGQMAVIVMVQDVTERRRAEERIQRYVKQLEGAMKSTLRVVSNMVDMRDPYTAGHERRVGLIARAIAREMGWDAARCESLEMIGLVHDIGKIAVPAEILSKPGRLTPLEMEIVRGHAQAGYEILKDVDFAQPMAEIIHQHHERLDGSGYPRGLKGDAILPEARVLTVADVLESMAAHRPYRPALGLDAALAELEQGRGRLFDPDVVAATLRLVRERGYVLPD